MQHENSSLRKITCRSLVAGAAAGTGALASDPASAQLCPATLARMKGALVWMYVDQHELDEAHDQSVYAFNARTVGARRVYNNTIAHSVLGKPIRVATGGGSIVMRSATGRAVNLNPKEMARSGPRHPSDSLFCPEPSHPCLAFRAIQEIATIQAVQGSSGVSRLKQADS